MRELIDYLSNSKLFSSVSVVIVIITIIVFSFIPIRKSTTASWFLGCRVTRTSMVCVVHCAALPLPRGRSAAAVLQCTLPASIGSTWISFHRPNYIHKAVKSRLNLRNHLYLHNSRRFQINAGKNENNTADGVLVFWEAVHRRYQDVL